MEFSNEEIRLKLSKLFSETLEDSSEKIDIVKQIFVESGSAEETKKAIKNYTEKAFSVLELVHISEEKKKLLKAFGTNLMNRTA